MKKRTFLIIAASILLALAVLAAIAFLPRQSSNIQWQIPTQGKYEKTLTVAADKDYPPYSFIDEQGVYSGHDVEMIYALGERMGVNIELHLAAWSDALSGLADGEYDMLLGVTYSPGRLETMEFSTATISDPYVVFGHPDGRYSSEKLSRSVISTISGDSVNSAYMIPYGLDSSAVYYSTYSECFESLKNGQCDYVIAPYTTGSQVIRALGLSDIRALGTQVYNSIFCIAFGKGNTALRDSVNSAKASLSADGTMDSIYDRWLVEYTASSSLAEFLTNNAELLAIILLLLALALFSVYYLTEKRSNRRLFIETERARISASRYSNTRRIMTG